jgi:hypothetical protein
MDVKLSDLTLAGWLVVLSTVAMALGVGIPFTLCVVKMFPPDQCPKLLLGAPIIVTFGVSLGVGIGVLRLFGLSMTKRRCDALEMLESVLDHMKDSGERGTVSAEERSKDGFWGILVILSVGAAGTCWAWYTACFHGYFSMWMAVLAPFSFVVGLALLAHPSAGEGKHWNELDWSARIERGVVLALGPGAGLANCALIWAYWLTKR